MVTKKETTKKNVKKATGKNPAKKALAKKSVTKKTPEKKTATTKKTSVKKVVLAKSSAKNKQTKRTVSQEQFFKMVSEAAYFAAQNDGNGKTPIEYWFEAEIAVHAQYNVTP